MCFWMWGKLLEKETVILHTSLRKKAFRVAAKHISTKTRGVQKTDCEHNHMRMNPLKGRPESICKSEFLFIPSLNIETMVI